MSDFPLTTVLAVVTVGIVLIRVVAQWGKPRQPTSRGQVFAAGCLIGLLVGFSLGIGFYIVFSLYRTRFI